jgi:hypothetical protein
MFKIGDRVKISAFGREETRGLPDLPEPDEIGVIHSISEVDGDHFVEYSHTIYQFDPAWLEFA